MNAERVRGQLHAARVWVLVAADEKVVVIAGRISAQKITGCAELRAQLEGRRGLFVAGLGGDGDADPGLARQGLEQLDDLVDRELGADLLLIVALPGPRPLDALFVG